MKTSKIKISANKDFEYFKKCCLEFADKWELNNWTFRFHCEKKGKFEGGSIKRNLTNCQADIYFEQNYHKDKPTSEILQTAKHEMIHCLLGKLYILGWERFAQKDEYDREEEELTHKLEKLL